jgi:hypothetical protein
VISVRIPCFSLFWHLVSTSIEMSIVAHVAGVKLVRQFCFLHLPRLLLVATLSNLPRRSLPIEFTRRVQDRTAMRSQSSNHRVQIRGYWLPPASTLQVLHLSSRSIQAKLPGSPQKRFAGYSSIPQLSFTIGVFSQCSPATPDWVRGSRATLDWVGGPAVAAEQQLLSGLATLAANQQRLTLRFC